MQHHIANCQIVLDHHIDRQPGPRGQELIGRGMPEEHGRRHIDNRVNFPSLTRAELHPLEIHELKAIGSRLHNFPSRYVLASQRAPEPIVIYVQRDRCLSLDGVGHQRGARQPFVDSHMQSGPRVTKRAKVARGRSRRKSRVGGRL